MALSDRTASVRAAVSNTHWLWQNVTAENRKPGSRPSPDIGRQSRGQVIEQEAHTARGFQIRMHHQPDLERVVEGVRQHSDKLGRTARDIFLTPADADTGAQSGQLGKIDITAEAEELA